jgi:phosphoserine phosphatase
MVHRVTAIVAVVALASPAWCGAEPLPGWRDTPARERIISFVTEVTSPGGRAYVTPADRVAVFDDDGTLWPEKPRIQGMFALQRLRRAAVDHPEWQNQFPYKAALDLGSKYLQEATDDAVFQLVAAAHAGQTQDAFRRDIREYFATARHPRFDKKYAQLAYAPMRDLLAYLKANGFHVFIATTGSVELARILAEDLYGVAADDVLGSSVVSTLREEDGRLVVRRLRSVHALNDGPMKPLTIDLHVGRRPILAVGNIRSGGDIDMLRFSQQPGLPSLQILVRHDDFAREYAYDEPDGASEKAANANGWLLVSMRYDWLRIFGAE